MPSSKTLLSGAALLASSVTFSAAAGATPNFPQALADHLGLSQAPECSLCHVGEPGLGTVNSPFGKSMRARGLVPYDVNALDTALDALEAEHTDSDGDGTPDIEELKADEDPNVPTGQTEQALTPEYGCRMAPSGRSDGSYAMGVTIAALFAAA